MSTLLSKTPVSRSTDPESSHLAEDEINSTSLRSYQQRQVLDAVRRKPGATARELAEQFGLDRYVVSRRLPELEPAYIQRGNLRGCMVGGRLSMTWWPRP